MVGDSRVDSEADEGNLQEGSLSLPSTLPHKTVDEVWKEIQGQKKQQEQDEEQKKQQQLGGAAPGGQGEMTLEDFLVKAGIVKDCGDISPAMTTFAAGFNADTQRPQADLENIVQQSQQQLEWYNYQLKQQQQQQQQQQEFFLQQQVEAAAALAGSGQGAMGGLLIPGTALDAPLDVGPGLAPGNLAGGFSLSPGLTPAIAMADTASKWRGLDVVERTVERRQRRMIKNRESAARSRARKQAYTMELETELMQLKEENVRLKRQRIVQTFASEQESKGPAKLILRRTRSASW